VLQRLQRDHDPTVHKGMGMHRRHPIDPGPGRACGRGADYRNSGVASNNRRCSLMA
jgi:hypothetical protein